MNFILKYHQIVNKLIGKNWINFNKMIYKSMIFIFKV